jgi:hypothetical protein
MANEAKQVAHQEAKVIPAIHVNHHVDLPAEIWMMYEITIAPPEVLELVQREESAVPIMTDNFPMNNFSGCVSKSLPVW